MNNLWIYEQGRAVPKEAQKPFSNGSFSGTDINPMWRIKKLTELFGPAGIGWYTEVLSERAETYGDTVMAIVDINLYIKVDGEWSKPIFGTGGNQLVQVTKNGARASDEGYKKAYTDALSIACKALGIGADIWYSKDPSVSDPTSKYAGQYTTVQKKPAPMKAAPQASEEPVLCCSGCGQPITAARLRDRILPPVEIAERSMQRFGRALCFACSMGKKAAGNG